MAYLIYILLFCFTIQQYDGGKNISYAMPETVESDTVICHTHYCFCYSEQHEQAFWLAYQIEAKMLIPVVDRAKSFRTDPKIETMSADNDDYYKSGYDKGHLAPARDMAFDPIAQEECFYFGNISPQVPEFNRGIWRGLEFKLRNWVNQFEKVYVVTGPLLHDSLPVIGENRVSVPEYFYKAVLVYNDTLCKSIGFVIPNSTGLGNAYSKYVVSVDSIETLTQRNLFYLLDDELENVAESETDYEFWQLIKPE